MIHAAGSPALEKKRKMFPFDCRSILRFFFLSIWFILCVCNDRNRIQYPIKVSIEKKTRLLSSEVIPSCRSPPSRFDFQQIQILEVTNVKNNGKRIIEIDGRRIEVSEEVYKEYQRGQRKERYIMKDLKRGQIKIDGEKITVKPGREDSVERLIETHPQYFVEKSDGPDELLDKKDLLECLTKALCTLTDEEWLLIQELYYLERTEREAGKSLHMASSTVHDRKIAILKKLRDFF